MLLPRRQNPPDIQVTHVDLLVSLPHVIAATLQYLQVRICIGRQKERKRVSLLPTLISNAMHGSRELAIRLLFKILAYVAHEGAWLWWRIDPDTVLIQDFEGGNGVL
jgi:hypothetical protein